MYQKQGSWNPAQAAYQASCELALYEAPLKALVDVARHLEETMELAHALEKLADFYAEKGAIALAIEKFNEAFEVGKVARVLEKLEALYSGEDNPSKMHELAIQRFELQISQDPKNIGLHRKYVWFLKDIGRKSEARAVKERMDELLQQKLVKQKTKIEGFKQTIHSQAEIIRHLQEQIQAHASKTDAALEGLQESLEFSKMTSLSLNNLTTDANYEHEDEDIIPLLHTNPHLKYLSLQNTRKLTNAVLAIIPERFENLEYLKINRCHKMTLAGLSAMIDRLPRLKKLLYYGIDGTVDEHNQLISKLNARRIKHGGLNFFNQ